MTSEHSYLLGQRRPGHWSDTHLYLVFPYSAPAITPGPHTLGLFVCMQLAHIKG